MEQCVTISYNNGMVIKFNRNRRVEISSIEGSEDIAVVFVRLLEEGEVHDGPPECLLKNKIKLTPIRLTKRGAAALVYGLNDYFTRIDPVKI